MERMKRGIMLTYKVKRKVTVKECDWLDNDIQEDTIVYKYYGHTYGCISHKGMAITFSPHKVDNVNSTFYELPRDALELVNTE